MDPEFPVRGHLQQDHTLPYRKRHPGSILRRLEKHSSLLLKMPIFYHNRPRTARISCGSGAGRSFLFVDIQCHPVLNQLDCLVQGLIPGEVRASDLRYNV